MASAGRRVLAASRLTDERELTIPPERARELLREVRTRQASYAWLIAYGLLMLGAVAVARPKSEAFALVVIVVAGPVVLLSWILLRMLWWIERALLKVLEENGVEAEADG